MIGAASALTGRLAEVAAHEGESSGTPAWVVGLTALVAFLVLLFAVTRLNRDR